MVGGLSAGNGRIRMRTFSRHPRSPFSRLNNTVQRPLEGRRIALYAITRDREIGVDVERIRPDLQMNRLQSD